MTIPAGFGQATFVFNGPGVPLGAACTLGFQNSAGSTASAAANIWMGLFDASITPLLTDDVGLTFVSVKLGPDATGPTGVSDSGDAGADVSAGAPPQIAYLVAKQTALGGRRGRGRMFIPGVDETEVSEGGAVSSTKRDALQDGFDDFLAAALGVDLEPMVLHDPATIWVLVDGQPRRITDPGAPAAPAPTAITSFVVSGTVATQRRRLRR